jgi:hypothetical protein
MVKLFVGEIAQLLAGLAKQSIHIFKIWETFLDFCFYKDKEVTLDPKKKT